MSATSAACVRCAASPVVYAVPGRGKMKSVGICADKACLAAVHAMGTEALMLVASSPGHGEKAMTIPVSIQGVASSPGHGEKAMTIPVSVPGVEEEMVAAVEASEVGDGGEYGGNPLVWGLGDEEMTAIPAPEATPPARVAVIDPEAPEGARATADLLAIVFTGEEGEEFGAFKIVPLGRFYSTSKKRGEVNWPYVEKKNKQPLSRFANYREVAKDIRGSKFPEGASFSFFTSDEPASTHPIVASAMEFGTVGAWIGMMRDKGDLYTEKTPTGDYMLVLVKPQKTKKRDPRDPVFVSFLLSEVESLKTDFAKVTGSSLAERGWVGVDGLWVDKKAKPKAKRVSPAVRTPRTPKEAKDNPYTGPGYVVHTLRVEFGQARHKKAKASSGAPENEDGAHVDGGADDGAESKGKGEAKDQSDAEPLPSQPKWRVLRNVIERKSIPVPQSWLDGDTGDSNHEALLGIATERGEKMLEFLLRGPQRDTVVPEDLEFERLSAAARLAVGSIRGLNGAGNLAPNKGSLNADEAEKLAPSADRAPNLVVPADDVADEEWVKGTIDFYGAYYLPSGATSTPKKKLGQWTWPFRDLRKGQATEDERIDFMEGVGRTIDPNYANFVNSSERGLSFVVKDDVGDGGEEADMDAAAYVNDLLTTPVDPIGRTLGVIADAFGAVVVELSKAEEAAVSVGEAAEAEEGAGGLEAAFLLEWGQELVDGAEEAMDDPLSSFEGWMTLVDTALGDPEMVEESHAAMYADWTKLVWGWLATPSVFAVVMAGDPPEDIGGESRAIREAIIAARQEREVGPDSWLAAYGNLGLGLTKRSGSWTT